MNRVMLKSKVHRATVTDADLHYVGSITIDTGDTIIVISYAQYDREDLESYAPRVVHVDRANRIISIDDQVASLLAGQEA